MSDLLAQKNLDCRTQTSPCQGVEQIIQGKEKDIGGFSVRRCLPVAQLRSVGPWVFFDHMGPAEFEPGKGLDVRPHPHINLATVTYLFEGEILHRDSLGTTQAIKPGDINLMVAGSGIVHSERERPQVREQQHRLHGLQLWHALPEEHEETAPAFYHYPIEDIPSAEIREVPVRVMMGSAWGLTSPVKTFCNTLYLEAFLDQGQSLILPEAQESALYVAEGQVRIQHTTVAEHSLAQLKANASVTIHADKKSRIAVIGGEPLGARFMHWNFISSRKERVEQAMADWKEQRFTPVPGDDKEYIPLP